MADELKRDEEQIRLKREQMGLGAIMCLIAICKSYESYLKKDGRPLEQVLTEQALCAKEFLESSGILKKAAIQTPTTQEVLDLTKGK